MTAPHRSSAEETDIHRSVESIASEVLQRNDIDPAMDLFDQGATSLALIRIVAQINERFAIEFDVAILEEASVDAMSEIVRAQTGDAQTERAQTETEERLTAKG
ncbi:acyl carrier protein [Streptomyces ziwulingensis]|uniref:Carrier domain-containing protein n=1 Tax=Streptomyces ziwulingensis TaxID=1045501 RepID=A0ABP9D0B8_9ACTN